MKREPTPHDKHVGERIRKARGKMTMHELADAIGVSHQQLQKYETGSNRVPSARLALLATLLNKPLTFFFPGDLPATRDALSLAQIITRLTDADQALMLNIAMRLERDNGRN